MIVNCTGFPGGRFICVRPSRRAPRFGLRRALQPLREVCSRSVRGGDGFDGPPMAPPLDHPGLGKPLDVADRHDLPVPVTVIRVSDTLEGREARAGPASKHRVRRRREPSERSANRRCGVRRRRSRMPQLRTEPGREFGEAADHRALARSTVNRRLTLSRGHKAAGSHSEASRSICRSWKRGRGSPPVARYAGATGPAPSAPRGHGHRG